MKKQYLVLQVIILNLKKKKIGTPQAPYANINMMLQNPPKICLALHSEE